MVGKSHCIFQVSIHECNLFASITECSTINFMQVRNLFERRASSERSGCGYSSTGESESASSDIQYSFPALLSVNVESGVVADISTNESLTLSSDSDANSILEHTDLQQKEDSLEPSISDSEFEVFDESRQLLEEVNHNSQNCEEGGNRPSASHAYKYDMLIKTSKYYNARS